MNIEELREYCLSKKGTTESFPFDETTLVFKVMNKMFTITDLEEEFAVVIKTTTDKHHTLMEEYAAVTQPRYFRGSWVRVLIDGSIDVRLIQEWIDESYEIIVKGLTKKDQKALGEL